MIEEAPILGRQRGLDQMIGNIVQRHGVILQNAAHPDIVAVAIEKLDAVFGRADLAFVEIHQRGQRREV